MEQIRIINYKNYKIIMKLFKIIFLILINTNISKILTFDNLTQAQIYTQLYTKGDIDLYVFNKSNKKLKDNTIKSCKKDDLWSIDKFQEILNHVCLIKQLKGYHGDFIIKFTPEDKVNFIIFGQLQSTFHSFVRDLTYLFESKIIDNNFKIIQPNFFMVILGTFKGEEYTFETFSLVLRLIQENPDRVIYIKDKYEVSGDWLSKHTKRQLNLKLPEDNDENKIIKDSVKSKINDFFNTNPYSLYITTKPDQGTIRISNSGFNYNKIKEKKFKNRLRSLRFNTLEKLDYNTMLYQNINNKYNYEDYAYIKAIIKNQKALVNHEAIKGLSTLEPKNGAIKWHVFSAPNQLNQKYFNAYYDAFCIINLDHNINDSTISLYNRNIKSTMTFSKDRTYNLVSTQILNNKPEFVFANNSTNDKLNQNEISEFKKNIKPILSKLQSISQKIYNLENKLNNYLFKIKSANLSLKQISKQSRTISGL